MKTLRIFSLASLFLVIAGFCAAQQKTETVKVSGECNMCKKKIEKASKDAGATYALWNKDTKVLTVKYNSTSTNMSKIETQIASVGYDTRDVKASDEAYNKLDQCCQYDREGSVSSKNTGAKKKAKTTMNCDEKSCSKKKQS